MAAPSTGDGVKEVGRSPWSLGTTGPMVLTSS